MKNLSIVLAATVALTATSPVTAASADYYLVIDGVDGESSVAAKVSSWSFGATQSSTPPSGASGRSENPLHVPSGHEQTNPLAETQHSVKSPRDAGSGLATGRRSGALQAADFNRDGAIDFAEAAQVDQLGALNLSVPAGSDPATKLCGKTDHLRSGHIISSDGTIYDLNQLSIVCSGSVAGIAGGAVAGIVVAGSMKHTKTGHVTLMK